MADDVQSKAMTRPSGNLSVSIPANRPDGRSRSPVATPTPKAMTSMLSPSILHQDKLGGVVSAKGDDCAARKRIYSIGSGESEGDATPRERHPNTQCVFSIEHLEDVLAGLGKDDLEALKVIRDAVDARCKELEAQPAKSSTSGSASEPENIKAPKVKDKALPGVEFADDGNKLPTGPTGFGDWEISREIGAGRYGKVFSAKNRKTGKAEAVKVLVKNELNSEQDWPNVCSEHESLIKVGKHPNIASMTGALQSEERVYFFLMFAKGKDLFDFCKLRQQNKTQVAKPAVSQIFKSVSMALNHCHQLGICHRDVKPENILVQQDYKATLVDFGCACPRLSLQNQCEGSLPFIAPEFMCGTATDGAPADVWSLGVVLLEMVHGLRILSKTLGWDTQRTTTQECGATLSAWCADPAKGLANIRTSLGITTTLECDEVLLSMLDIDPEKRPTTEALCDGAWLKQFNS